MYEKFKQLEDQLDELVDPIARATEYHDLERLWTFLESWVSDWVIGLKVRARQERKQAMDGGEHREA